MPDICDVIDHHPDAQSSESLQIEREKRKGLRRIILERDDGIVELPRVWDQRTAGVSMKVL